MYETSVRTILPLAVALTLIVAPEPACAQVAREGPSPDSAIRAVWSMVDAMWNARDAERFSHLFTEDAGFEFVDRRESLESRSAIHQSFAERFPQFAPDLRHLTTVQDIRRITPDVHAVTGSVEILRLGADDRAEPTVLRSFVIFAVMLRTGEGFRIHILRAYQLPEAAS
jgi:uncharacterized protein (TIGR02246 family)